MSRQLVAIMGTKEVGMLSQTDSGSFEFRYADGYDGIPLSLSLPVRNGAYAERRLRPYLFGLLPDSEAVRRDIAREFDVSANNPLALLEHIGLDCPGGVQFCTPDSVSKVLGRSSRYVSLSDEQICNRLRRLRQGPEDSWVGRGEHWSLGGNQGKFALALREGAWCSCEGSAATTHIFKNGVLGYSLQALNEYVCMRLAAACNLPVSRVEYRMFGDEPAIVVRCYDRAVGREGEIARIHQEDLCQALGVMPDMKYTIDGGPGALDVVRLLSKTSRARTNVELFTRMLFFNTLIGAPDAHAKNYSVLLGGGGDALLAPMYDITSGLCYESMRRDGRLAMGIGGENRFGRMSRKALSKYAEGAGMRGYGFDEAWCVETMLRIESDVIGKIGGVFDASEGLPGIEELRSRMETPITRNFERIMAQLK